MAENKVSSSSFTWRKLLDINRKSSSNSFLEDEYKQRKHNNVAFLTPATPHDAVYTVDQQSTPGTN